MKIMVLPDQIEKKIDEIQAALYDKKRPPQNAERLLGMEAALDWIVGRGEEPGVEE